MSNYFYIKLTLAVYRVTELFPKGEALAKDTRKIANEILVDLIKNKAKNISQNIEKIERLFDLAEAKNWVDARNFLVLRREYSQIGRSIQENKRISSGKAVEKSFRPKKRKEEILEILKTNDKIKVGDLIKSFPALNRRTLLRDLDGFYRVGLIKKNGNGRGACYTIKNATL